MFGSAVAEQLEVSAALGLQPHEQPGPPEEGAILPCVPSLVDRPLVGGRTVDLVLGSARSPVLGREDDGARLADRFLSGKARDAFRTRVPAGDDALSVQADDGEVVGPLHDLAVAAFALLPCCFGLLQRRDVAGDGEHFFRLPIHAEHRGDDHVPPTRIPLHGGGEALELARAALLGLLYGVKSAFPVLALPVVGQMRPWRSPKSSTSMTRMPPSFMNSRRPSRSRTLMQSPEAWSTRRLNSSI